MSITERHILGISGGRDSAALAVHLRQTRPELQLEYFFTDTGKELKEVYDFLDRLEGFLGKPIARLNALHATVRRRPRRHETAGAIRGLFQA
jgi:3'-phosphoadenosine 5'-phosphosulfate sulfotransferase (PAPS reductase)/FAD synthetase